MAVLEMLSEVIRAEKLFALVAFTKLVDICKMLTANHPVRSGIVRELFSTVAADVERSVGARLRRWNMTTSGGVGWYGGAWMKSGLVVSVQSRAGPRMTT